MSQAGIVDFEGAHPQVPTAFVTDMGTAIPIANVLEILGTIVAAHSIPLETTGSGNTVTIVAQYASAAGASLGTNAGMASFNSTFFTVDANGFVSFNGAGAGETITGNTGGPLSPVAGNWNILGAATAAGAIPVQTAGSGNTLTVQVQRSQAIGATNAANVGLAAFNSTFFTVDGNGFVSINGSAIGETITGNTGGALSPTAGNWNILGTSTAAGTTPVQTAGAGSTLTVQVQKSQAIATTNATNVGLAAFNSTFFTVDANGFVSINGSAVGETITGNTGGALSPTAGNWNILGTSTAAGTTPVQTSGAGSTLTVQVQKAQAIAATDATKVGLAAFDSARFTVDANGFVSLNGSGAAQTITGNTGGALSPTAGNWNIVGTGTVSTSGSGSTLTISVAGGALNWIDQTADLNPLVKSNAYEADKVTLLTLTLPTGGTFGDTIRVQGFGAGGWILNAGTGQTIQVEANATTVGGSVASTNRYDYIQLTCSTTTTTWFATSHGGNLTLA